MATFGGLQQGDFPLALQRLLPRGRAWTRDTASTLAAVLNGAGDATYAVHANFVDLLETESFPATAVQLLTDFETDYGLPDPCTPLNPTIQQRQAALLFKIAAVGGQSIDYFVGVAAALGFAITITEFEPFSADMACDLPDYDVGWKFVWQVNAPSITTFYFSADESAADDYLETIDGTELVCRFGQIKPAHTLLIYAFS
jgi:uncharacterized protein YmfQ (DUF2313 family)